MAIYHLSIKIISRGKGKSAVAAAAYRAGEKIINEYDGLTHDYTKKSGVVHTEILLPDHAPGEYADRAVLWNAVEKIEIAKNSQLAREIELALPVELTGEQNISLVREYVKRHFADKGMCADIAIHDKNNGNPHAHIMLNMRPINEDGTWGAKSKKEYILDENGERIKLKSGEFKTRKINATDWNEQTKAEEWRAAWADICNQFLEKENHAKRIDHSSYARQGIDQIPTVHLGVAAFQMEKRGIRTEIGDKNRSIIVTNQHLRQLKARITKLQNWLKEETETPTLADVISNILVNADSQMLNFLRENRIMDMAGLRGKVEDVYGQLDSVMEKMKPIDRRLKTLQEHIKQAGYYMEFREIYRQYKQVKPKHQEDFRESHRREITLYEAAHRYLIRHMNGQSTLPIKEWEAAVSKLTAEKNMLHQEYVLLKRQTKEVEQIRRSVENILREEMQRKQPKRTREMER